MYSITELKKGTFIDLDGRPYQVVEYSQKVMGRGGSIVNVKLKNLLDNSVLTKTFKGNEKVAPAQIDYKKSQFLYADKEQAYFMDQRTFEQISLPLTAVKKELKYLPENTQVTLQYYKDRAVGLELPVKVALKVTDAPEVVKGDTQSTVMKTARVETGSEIMVPIFIKPGDTIIVDTRNGTYVERQK